MKTKELRTAIIKEMKGSVIFNGFTTMLYDGCIGINSGSSSLFSGGLANELDIHFYAEDDGFIMVYARGYGTRCENLKECFAHIVEVTKRDCQIRINQATRLYNGVLANEELDGYKA